MTPEAEREIAKAEDYLEKARQTDPARLAEGVIHFAYYAMYAASYALMQEKAGGASTKHQRLQDATGRFLTRQLGEEGTRLAAAYERAMRARFEADYSMEVRDRQIEARETLATADALIGAIKRLLRE